MAELLPPNSIIVIYFFYGLAFFIMGLAVAFEAQRSASNLPFAQAMYPLAAFGLLHGGHEWLEMFIRESMIHGIDTLPLWLEAVRVGLLALSFASLIAFAIKILYPGKRLFGTEFYISSGMLIFWTASIMVMALVIRPGDATHLTVRSWLLMADTWSRYSLAIPGALISSYALWRQASALAAEQQRFKRNLYLAAGVFFIYGAVAQIFVNETYLFPSQLINAALFERIFGVPVQFLRALLAIALAVTLVPTLNMFELERRKILAAAEQRARDELARRETFRREMLQHTVKTQEEERRRIARELHDEIGQTLTGLSLGLENLLQIANATPSQLPGTIKDLRQLTANATSELSHLVTDLRPSQLDHLGLSAALRSLTKEYGKRFGLKAKLEFAGQRRRLQPDIELAIFRIAQEALTNVVRHSGVSESHVRLCFEETSLELCVCDKGMGFTRSEMQHDEDRNWGLLGMTERATQLGGTLTIDTAPGQGTRIWVRLPCDEEIAKKKGSNG